MCMSKLAHVKKYIGVYLTLVIVPFMFGWGVDEDHPIWVWWIAFGLIVLKTPPYSVSDRFWGAYTRLLEWILGPLLASIKKWPWWARSIFAVVVFYCTETYILAPLGYTMLPWRMDFG